MKAIKRILVAVMCSAAAVSVFAESITLNLVSGKTFAFVTVCSIKVPSEVVKIMNDKKITNMFVIEDNKPIGTIHIHDLLKNGVA